MIDLFQRSVRETAAADYSPAQIDVWAQADRDEWEFARLSHPTWVALVGGELAGFADLEKSGLLDMMFVHPAHQRKDVVTALLARVEAEAGEAGVHPCTRMRASLRGRSLRILRIHDAARARRRGPRAEVHPVRDGEGAVMT